jgi:hypothetical protein
MSAADSLVPTIVAVSAAVGGRELVALIFARRKTSAEAEAFAAGAVASRADAAQTLTEAAGALVRPLTEQIAYLRSRVDELERREHDHADALRRRDDQHAEVLRRHAKWDRSALDTASGRGIDLGRVPPLYPESTPPTPPPSPGG